MKTKHVGITTCIKHLAVSGLSNISARIKSSCILIGNRIEMPNVSYTQPLAASIKTDRNIEYEEIIHYYSCIQ